MDSGGAPAQVGFTPEKTVIQAISEATVGDAVKIENEEIEVAEDIKVVTNLHNVGVGGVAPSFSGDGVLELSGDNSLFSSVTLNCPVKISGSNAIPANATFENNLEVAESAEIREGDVVVARQGAIVAAGKSLEIKGSMTLGRISE